MFRPVKGACLPGLAGVRAQLLMLLPVTRPLCPPVCSGRYEEMARVWEIRMQFLAPDFSCPSAVAGVGSWTNAWKSVLLLPFFSPCLSIPPSLAHSAFEIRLVQHRSLTSPGSLVCGWIWLLTPGLCVQRCVEIPNTRMLTFLEQF